MTKERGRTKYKNDKSGNQKADKSCCKVCQQNGYGTVDDCITQEQGAQEQVALLSHCKAANSSCEPTNCRIKEARRARSLCCAAPQTEEEPEKHT